ncbi:Benzoyl-CoA reductase/2-hydroxyglutaryl-CoA dehydratase subunit, BcrC/BadD/HgdB [Thermodesulfobium acidiphilum]|uniref:Benzoyl-CoA reductase/2-hydroxyglutaryl-CoA dehydratase subunit, BcrC/BadD/HgdB n=2 Tax=Thermodesulfobium acidiphilum TaxID=1794699 RepID=A0A2R4W239_THEAF|nr:double-cubane-cluster-containing anaerobic reductase [Thermodesulfobium acidiphilum]AWB10877.1 Benzoyl-CoA reductase/2-hydroxyglutaryl-CoA dehydratase subunit, BcrC/BadD/HgdB [Thermodesulfobium acidiphilum]
MDNTKMHKSLGIDLKAHDTLIRALPELFKECFLNKEQDLKSLSYFYSVVADIHGTRVKELIEHKNKGPVIGSFCIYVPEEIILAIGGQLVGLCAGADFWVPYGEQIVPKNLCPLIKAGIGAKFSKTCPYFQVIDLLIGENTCDGKKKAWEILSDMVEMYIMDMPNKKSNSGLKLWQEEVKSLCNFLEKKFSKPISFDSLLKAVQKVNAKRSALNRLYETRKNSPTPISGIDTLLVTQIGFYDDTERYTKMVETLAKECEEKALSNSKSNDKKRILVTGSPMVVPNWKVHHVIETSGADVVVEENCTGTRYFKDNVSIENSLAKEDLLKNISDRYIRNINCACFSPNTDREEEILKICKDYKVDGIVYASLSFCTTYMIEAEKIRKVAKKNNIPMITVESDYSFSDLGQLRTRIEAFIENL